MTGLIYVGRHEPDTSDERELDDDSKPPWMCQEPYCGGRLHHRGQCREGESLPREDWVDCCQHSGYSFTLRDSTRSCKCDECGHAWLVMLGGPDKRGICETDYMPNELEMKEAS